MNISYVARKCTQCAGKLEYIKENKSWKCLYCGAEIERKENYDGLFTIKNVVRQTMRDVAYRRMATAANNLVECEKIDYRYIGTLLARIVYQTVSSIMPDQESNRDIRTLLSQLKRAVDELHQRGEGISEEENALYDFLESSDIYATLLFVYDALNDELRKSAVESRLNPAEVYAPDVFNNLLLYAFKNGKNEMADQMIAGGHAHDLTFVLSMVLADYPDDTSKRKHVEHLFKAGAFTVNEKGVIEHYLETSADHGETKGLVVTLAYSASIKVNMKTVIRYVLSESNVEQAKSVLAAACSRRLHDEDISVLVELALTGRDKNGGLAVLESLREGAQFVLIPSRPVNAMLSRGDLKATDKKALLEAALSFNMNDKEKEAIIADYLCLNEGDAEERGEILAVLLGKVNTVPTAVLEQYVLKCSTDGEQKARIVSKLFELDLNRNFFHNLLSRYLIETSDSRPVKLETAVFLIDLGLKADHKSFADYLCLTDEDEADKIHLIKKMLDKGIQLRTDAASLYLEHFGGERFNPELFTLIYQSSSVISEQALVQYLLYCKDNISRKAANVQAMLSQHRDSIGSYVCIISYNDVPTSCNLLQAYILTAVDDMAVARQILALLNDCKLKTNKGIRIDEGKPIKFKRFIDGGGAGLPLERLAYVDDGGWFRFFK